ncbi:MAG TPA: PQQ-binding-like beta-propeller repeat protein [Gemmataceae bacterium]|nr:PQQ-binding-like beta-propeller repeat protein [Gemmataceae bacterium]
MKTRPLPLLAALLAAALPAFAADWPQWRGPDRTDVSKETGLLKTWPDGGPKLLWTYRDAGVGYSGPAVVGDRLYSLGADDKEEFVFCLDTKTGKKLWQTAFTQRFRNGYGDGPRGTPTVDGDLLYAIGGTGDLVCLNRTSGERQWLVGLKKELGGQMMSGWGYTESPLIDGDKVVCTPGGSKGAVAAFNKKTGELLWRSKEFTDPAAYSSLMIGNGGGIKQYVQMTGQSVAGVDASNGKLLWRYPRRGPTAAIPTPIVSGDYVYATSGYGAGCNLVKLVPTDSRLKAEEVYASKSMTNHHGGVIKVGEHVYGYSDNGGKWICQDFKTGRVVWPTKNVPPVKLGKGSITYADGQFYLYAERDGTCLLVEMTPDGWRENGRFTIPEQTKVERQRGHIWTHPTVANGRLYLRDQDLIFCFDISGK